MGVAVADKAVDSNLGDKRLQTAAWTVAFVVAVDDDRNVDNGTVAYDGDHEDSRNTFIRFQKLMTFTLHLCSLSLNFPLLIIPGFDPHVYFSFG